MSILRVTDIRSNGSTFNDVVTHSNSGGTENGKLARAWVNFNGQGAVAMRANFNVNSITDNGTGDFTMNFANAMSDGNFCVAGVGDYGGVSTSDMRFFTVQTTASTNVRVAASYANGAGGYDYYGVNIVIFR